MLSKPGDADGNPRRVKVILLAALALAAAAVIVFLVVVRSGSSDAVTSNQAEIKRQLLTRLHDHQLDPLSVVCVPSGRRFEAAAVIRCNVNYGDPHVEAVCSVLRGGNLLTSHDETAIPCGPDLAGAPPVLETY